MCPGVVVIIIMRLLTHGCLCMSSKRVNEDVCNNAYREMCWVIEESFVFFACKQREPVGTFWKVVDRKL